MQTMLDLGTQAKTIERLSDINENTESLLKELAEDKYKYDLRFWPDNKISLEAIEKVADNQLNITVHRIEYVIKKIIKLGSNPEQIYQVILQNYESKIKELSQHWWRNLTDFYKTILPARVLSKNLKEIAEWGKHASQCYQDYKMFCEYIGESPQPEPEYIEKARKIYLKLNKKREAVKK